MENINLEHVVRLTDMMIKPGEATRITDVPREQPENGQKGPRRRETDVKCE